MQTTITKKADVEFEIECIREAFSNNEQHVTCVSMNNGTKHERTFGTNLQRRNFEPCYIQRKVLSARISVNKNEQDSH